MIWYIGRLQCSQMERRNFGQKAALIEDGKSNRRRRVEDKKTRWMKPTKELYDKENKPTVMPREKEEQIQENNINTELLVAEFKAAINELKNSKGSRVDDLTAESNESIFAIAKLRREIYNGGIWAQGFTMPVILLIPRRAETTKCGVY